MILSLLEAAESQLSFKNVRQFSNIIHLSKDDPDGIQGRPGLGPAPDNQIISMLPPF
jgi:hypothetical protein